MDTSLKLDDFNKIDLRIGNYHRSY